MSNSRMETAGDVLSALGSIAGVASPLVPAGPWQSALRIASAALTAGSRLLYQGADGNETLAVFERLGEDYQRLRTEAIRRAQEMEGK